MNLNKFIIKKKLISLFFCLSLFLLAIGFYEKIRQEDLSLGFSRIGNLFSKMYPFDTSIIYSLKTPILETINVAIFSSVLGLITALLILPFTMVTLYKIKFFAKLFSAVLSFFRTIPFLIIAAILVSLFSTGIFSGFISMYIINFLVAAKLLKEYAEEIDDKNISSLISLGVTKFTIYRKAILPTIKEEIIAIYFFMLESSIRGASVLGLVGAGGIGQKLWQELNHLRYDRVAVIILVLIFLIFLIDIISLTVRKYEGRRVLTAKSYFLRKKVTSIIFSLVVISSFYYVATALKITSDRFYLGLKQLRNLFYGLINPDINYFTKAFEQLVISVNIAFFSTLLAALTAIFISYFTAKNLSGKYNSLIMKIIVNILRTFPPIIVALIFFRGFGPGMVSSFFALYFYTIGVITKMYGEVLEGINNNILFMTKSLGISGFRSYVKIIFKGYFPEFISIVLYRFEMNIKNSTILGMVGAGGIGHLLVNNIEFRNWNRISTLLIILCLTIIIIENISYLIRKKIKE